jgi:CheY-like chemotaxis protein
LRARKVLTRFAVHPAACCGAVLPRCASRIFRARSSFASSGDRAAGSFNLPPALPNDLPVPPASPSAQRLAPILIVDDDPDERFLVHRLVSKCGLDRPIHTLTGGTEAIAFLRASTLAGGGSRGDRPAVLLLDVNMPFVSGFDVLTWIRQKPAWQKLRVIVLSNSDDPADAEQARALGADSYLIKYPTVAALEATLRTALFARPTQQPVTSESGSVDHASE